MEDQELGFRVRFNNICTKYDYRTNNISGTGKRNIVVGTSNNNTKLKSELYDLTAELKAVNECMRLEYQDHSTKLDTLLKSMNLITYEYKGRGGKDKRNKVWYSQMLSELSRIHSEYAGTTTINHSFSNMLLALAEGEYLLKEADKVQLAKDQEGAKFMSIMNLTRLLLSDEVVQSAIDMGATRDQVEKLYCTAYQKNQDRLGDSVDCDCDECESYTMGEHRCDCGNRRINAYTEIYYTGTVATAQVLTEAY